MAKKNAPRRVARSRDDLLEALAQQFRFLVGAGERFDAGDAAEASTIATKIRVLVHDGRDRTRSLLGELKLKDRIRYPDTAQPLDLRNLLPIGGLARWRVADDERSAEWLATKNLLPPEQRRRPATFGTWWRTWVMKDTYGALWSREKLVLPLANQDGGAHVDAELEERYAALTRKNGMGWRFHLAGTEDEGEPIRGNPVLTAVRQVGWELEWSLRQYAWRELGLEACQTAEFVAPDPVAVDPRPENERPYVDYRLTVDGGPTGRFLRLENRGP